MSVFKHQPNLRLPILEDLGTSVLPYIYPVGGKAPSRLYLAQGAEALGSSAGGGGSLPIQMCVALVMGLVQGTADVPPADGGAKAAYEKCGIPHIWADRFWLGVMERLVEGLEEGADDAGFRGSSIPLENAMPLL